MGSSGHPDGCVAASDSLGGVGGYPDHPCILPILILTVYICKSRAKHKKISEFPQRSKKNNNLCDIFLKQEMDNKMFKQAFLPIDKQKCTFYNSYFYDFRPFFCYSLRARCLRSRPASLTLYRAFVSVLIHQYPVSSQRF